jgi:hypothetical protein
MRVNYEPQLYRISEYREWATANRESMRLLPPAVPR